MPQSQSSKGLDKIYAAFRDFVDRSEEFDVVRSDKTGYLYCLTDDLSDWGHVLDTPEKMLSYLAAELVSEVAFSHPALDRAGNALTDEEKATCRLRLSAILDQMSGDTAAYRQFLWKYLEEYRF